MLPNRTKRKIMEDKVALGCFVNFTSPTFVEACGSAGLDYVLFDCEHWDVSLDGAVQMIRAAELYDMTPLARAPLYNRHLVGRLLDAGLQGVMVPHCDTAEDAKTIVNWVKYPPEGHRGLHTRGRTTRIGSSMTPDEYVKTANQETLVICMCEDVKAVQNLDDIMAVPGVDVIEIGPGDLRASMGFPPLSEVDKAVDELFDRVRKAGKPWGRAGVTSDTNSISTLAGKGGRFLTFSSTDFLINAIKSLVGAANSINQGR